MIPSIPSILGKIGGHLYRRSIAKSLALHDRCEARGDGLTLGRVQTRLKIEWHARGIHPWDRGRHPSQAEMERQYAQQCLSDTESAIAGIFARLPQVDTIEVTVLDQSSGAPILAGTVFRSALEKNKKLSVGMRLVLSGLTFRISGCNLDALDLQNSAADRDATDVAA